MTDQDSHLSGLPRLLTTKEVADLLRVKERKVYDLAAAGEIPHRRLTGKLLFPADEISNWISGGKQVARPDIVVGSHDPLLDWAVRESGCGLAVLFDGSGDGLARFATGDAALCGLHIPEEADWNMKSVAAAGLSGAVLISWANRRQGLMLRSSDLPTINGLSDLVGRRVALRQKGAGSRSLFDRLAADAGLVVPADAATVRTETEAAEAVASGEADAALGLEAAAGAFGLSFKELAVERFDLLVDRRCYFTEPVQKLLTFARTDAFGEKAKRLGGYDVSKQGEVRWVSP